MKIISYDRILENCIKRTSGDLKNIKKYIEKYEWKNIIIERHQNFINEYIKKDYNLTSLSLELKLSSADLLSIFLRIESQFELYEELGPDIIFKDLAVSYEKLAEHPLIKSRVNEINDKKKVKNKTRKQIKSASPIKRIKPIEQIKPAEPIKVVEPIKEIIKPNTGNTQRDSKLTELLIRARNMDNLEEVIGSTRYIYVKDLLKGKSIAQIAASRKKNSKYLLSSLLGVKNPRSNCEMGLERLMDKNM